MSDYEDDYFRNEDDYDEDFEESYKRQQTNTEDNYSDNEANSESDGEEQREKSELELRREEGIKRRNEILQSLMNDPEFADVVAFAKETTKQEQEKKVRKYKKASRRFAEDPSFAGRVAIPIEIRRSSRLQNIPPVFFKEDLIDETEISRKRKRAENYDYYDLETVIYQPRKSRTSGHNSVRHHIIPVEEVTDAMIAKIARRGTVKVYSEKGTSCHQCRQKTIDQKSCCRNVSCVGVRGQFCGVCLDNRYGEDVATVLKDPLWNCPVCRGICNCSFCRQKAGKRPTGMLIAAAIQNGHKCVKTFLDTLKGEGDYAHQDSMWKEQHDPKNLLGFSKDMKFAHMGKDTKHELNYFLDSEKLKKYIADKESELESMKDIHDQPASLLGFFKDTDVALLDDGTRCYMGPSKQETENSKEANLEKGEDMETNISNCSVIEDPGKNITTEDN